MPRLARVKKECAIYHIMVRSISELDLFKEDEDKIMYLNLIKEYKKTYLFKIYAYCLMTNHGHIIINSNGADISKIMHCINFKYARYFNEKYKRHGHLFQDRFKSKIVNNERYLYALTIYIHNNATSIYKFRNRPHEYKFSSLKAYLNNKSDRFNVLDRDLIKVIFNQDNRVSLIKYKELIKKCKINDMKELDGEFENEGTQYEKNTYFIKRNFSVEKVINFVCKTMNIYREGLYIKNYKGVIEAKAVLVVLMRVFCNIRCKHICKIFGNITESRVSALFTIGSKLITENREYADILHDFLQLNYKEVS